MANNNSEQTIGGKREGKERVDFEIREIIRAFPEDYPRILQSLEDWTKQFD